MPTIEVTKEQLLDKLPHRAVIILRGCPGAGKSTFITDIENYLGSPFANFEVVSADHYFIDDNGDYVFNKHLLRQAHAACFENFECFATRKGNKRPIYIVVDNTNTTNKEMGEYIDCATKNDWDVIIVTFMTHPSIAAPRNVHGVPAEKVAQMYERMVSAKISDKYLHYVVK